MKVIKEVRVAFIGCGMITNQHMDRYSRIPNVKVVAACDINKERLDAFCKKYNVEHGYLDFREMLKRDDIDAVDVCLHNNLHVPVSLAVLRAGKHCYCEKPMAGSYRDAKNLYDTAKKLGLELSIHLDFLFSPHSRIAKQFVDDGLLGKIYHARSVGYRRRMRPGADITGPNSFAPEFISKKWAGHGALYDMGVYHISQMLYVMGIPKLQRVTGHTYSEIELNKKSLGSNKFEVEELGLGLATYEGNLSLDIIESWAINMDHLGASFVAGSKGGLRFGGPNLGHNSIKYLHMINGQTVETEINIGENEGLNRTADPLLEYDDNDQTHWIAYLSGKIKERKDTAWLALQTMLVSEGIFLSGKLGREVTADEIENLSESNAITSQETPFGIIKYEL